VNTRRLGALDEQAAPYWLVQAGVGATNFLINEARCGEMWLACGGRSFLLV
jgi:hypothetical protein